MTKEKAMSGDAPMRRVAPEILRARFAGMMDFAAATRAGSDPEALHDMRVASRRLRAALDAFAPAYGGRVFRRALRETKLLTRALGSVRDDDVLLDTLRQYAETVPADEAPAIARFIAQIEAGREGHRAALLHDLDTLDANRYARRFREAVSEPLKRGAACAQVAKMAQRIVAAHTDAFYSHAPRLNDPDAVTELHEMRIAAKKLRYALELFAEPLGSETAGVIATVKEFQEIVGEIHDADVRVQLLTEYLHTRMAQHAGDLAAEAQAAEDVDAVKARVRAEDALWLGDATALVAAIARTAAGRRERHTQLRDRWQQWEAEGLHDRLAALAHPPEVAQAA